jgi:hypothetical protein
MTMSPLDRLTQAVGGYMKAKHDWVACQQKNFRQLCAKCPEYSRCDPYGQYVAAWSNLQDAYNCVVEETKEEVAP